MKNTLRRIVILSTTFFICHIVGIAQNASYYFKHITSQEGLSQHTVLCILQDRQGFMWFGTKDGVNRYDGTHFKIFSTDTTNGEIQDCVINSLCETKDGLIWVGSNKGVSIYDPEKESFSQFQMHSFEFDGEIRRAIKGITEDSTGKVWICDFYRGIYCYDPSSKRLKHISLGAHERVPFPSIVFEDKNGSIWVGTNGHGLYTYDDQAEYFKLYEPITNSEINANTINVNSMIDLGNELYLGSYDDGLLRLNIDTKQLTEITSVDGIHSPKHILSMKRMNSNEVWIGTDAGLYIYNERQGIFSNLKMSNIDRFSLSDNTICSLYKDKDNGIWIGSAYGGINYLPHQSTIFNKYYPLNDNKTISGKVVRNILEDKDGFLWIGTEDAGLNKFNPKTGEFKYYPLSASTREHDNIQAMCFDDDKLWISVLTRGIYLLDTKTGKIKHYEKDKAPSLIYSLAKDRAGDIWAGNEWGGYIYNKTSDSFRKVDILGNFYFTNIKQDYLGNIWFAAISNGVVCYNPSTKNVVRYINTPKDPTTIATKVIGIYEDRMNNLWFTTEGWGFCRFDRNTETFKRYTLADGLPNSVIYCITEDTNGQLWLGTNKGLVCFDPNTEKIKVFTQQDGLLSEQFNTKAALTAKDGTIYMGTIEGLISFNPVTFKEKVSNSFAPVITGLQILNNEVLIGEDSPLKKSISLTDKITLSYKQNSLSFDFASFNYNLSQNHLLFYRLEGLEKEWHILKENQKISYANLPTGEYILRIQEANKNKEGCSLRIVIEPPIWRTTYAYGLYIILVLTLLIYIYRKSSMRIKMRHKEDMIKLKADKEREAYNAKIAFFTDVAHEVRTPLSLIKGPLESILKKEKVDKDTKQDLLIMQRNTDRLQTLINQLLDFRKTESGKFSLSFHKEDIVKLLNELYERFLPTFLQRNLDVKLTIQKESFFVGVDKEAFTKIISNLFVNASKFADKHIEVELWTDIKPHYFMVVVKNDGNIIKEDLIDKIFEPFFQINSENNENMKTGTGLGLSLSRNLAELHDGRLYVEKESAQYNKFVLEFPINEEYVYSSVEEENEVEELATDELVDENTDDNKEDYKVLIIEDNPEMQTFIVKQLDRLYHVVTADNGEEALSILDKEYIDVIVSDIAMPKIDGYELLKRVKSDIKYSHIPVILLTARTSLESKIEGLSLGADAYIEKPFSIDFLLVQISNLLEGRKTLKNSFVNSPYLYSNSIALTKADEEFMEKVNDVVEQNLDNIEFNIGDLSHAMNVSHSSLLRKIKGISGLTVNEYIRLLRLKKAALLLEENRYRINEICTLTGFNNPSYFTKCFYKQFGILPKDFINKDKASNT